MQAHLCGGCSSRESIKIRRSVFHSSLARGHFVSRFSMEQRLTAAAQREKLGLLQSVAPDGCPVALPVERAMPLCHGPEESVKKVEADAEVAVHEAYAVHASVMNVMQSSGSQEPRSQEWNSRHPEVFDMHPVVQIAEHEDGPAEQRAQRERLVHMRHAEKRHHSPAKQQNDRGGRQPFDPRIADGEAVIRRVVVLSGAHGLPGAINQEVMDQMAPAECWEPAAVQ